MKRTMILALTAIMMAAGAVTANAQEKVVTLDQLMQAQKNRNNPKGQATQAKSQTTTTTRSTTSGVSDGWTSAYLQLNPSWLHYSYKGVSENASFTAITLGWNTAMPIISGTPLYVQPGIALQYGWDTDEDDYEDYVGGSVVYKKIKTTTTMVSLKIPVNLVYSWQIPGSNISLDPYWGLYARGFIIGTMKTDGEDSINMFSKDDMNGHAAKRFTLGTQLGANVRFGSFYAGLEYATDFTKFVDHTTIQQLGLQVGLLF